MTHAFTKPPAHPYWSLWIALFGGCVIASIWASIVGVNMPFLFALFISILGGGALTLLVAMPVVWLFVRIGYAGPASAIITVGLVFLFVMEGPIAFFPREVVGSGLVYVGAVVICYLLVAYTPAVYQNGPCHPVMDDNPKNRTLH